MIVKVCSRNVTDYATTLVYKEKINLTIPGSQSNENDKTGIFDGFVLIANFYVLKLWLTLIKKIWWIHID